MSFRNLILLLGSVVSATALASDYHSPRVAGMGGAGHAAPILNDGLYLNPSVIALLPAYSVSASHESVSGPNNTEPQTLVQNLSIQDGTNSVFAAGLGYTRKTYGREVHVGASTKIFQTYGVGLGGKFLFGSDSKKSTQDASLSATGAVNDWIQAGLIVDNLMETANTKSWGQYREIILGLKFNIQKILIVYLDPHLLPGKPGDTFGYELGAELPIFSDLYIRGGLNKNAFQPALGGYGHGHGFGIGWAFPRISFDFAITRSFEPARTNNMLFSVTIL